MDARKMAGIVAVAAVLLAAGAVQAAIAIDTVPVGNPGNAGEWSGESYGGYGTDRICGSVSYEYKIGKYEVTAGQYTEFLNKVAATDTYGLYNTYMDTAVVSYGCNIKRTGSSGTYAYTVDANWANRPVNYVSFWDSCRFANWLQNGQPTGAQGAGTTERGAYTLDGYDGTDGRTIQRNPDANWAVTSEDEWYKAAYYNPVTATYYDYPTSSNSVPSNDLTTPDGGNNANFDQSGYTIDSPYYRTPVGEFELSESPYGTFDQGGNVWEWNEAIVWESSTYAYRGQRGGTFYMDYVYLHASGRDYGLRPNETYDFGLGFRVSEVPEPLSAAVLLVGGVFLSRRRARRA